MTTRPLIDRMAEALRALHRQVLQSNLMDNPHEWVEEALGMTQAALSEYDSAKDKKDV